MSVRRLAEETVQPKDFAFNKANGALAKTWIAKYPEGRQASAVIPLLMIAQEQEGWVTRASIEHVAGMLSMPYIRVLEVATFYTQFMLAPVGTRAHIQVCGTTPCMLRGSEALMAVCKQKIHPEPFHTNKDGTLSWEEVECQGACVNAPMVMIFKDAYEDLTSERLAEIIDAFEAGKGSTVTPGPQIDRIHSAPEGGLTSLADEKMVTKSGGRAKKTESKGKRSGKKEPR
ncbi:MAG: NADH-quinone oxidoreductase subunit NuoE [Nitratireductor sp.]|nr:NADH-quinone oxidoreductase subunit NuoE [Nitratireductor sp.]